MAAAAEKIEERSNVVHLSVVEAEKQPRESLSLRAEDLLEEHKARYLAALSWWNLHLDHLRLDLNSCLAAQHLRLRTFGDLVANFASFDAFVCRRLGIDDLQPIVQRRSHRRLRSVPQMSAVLGWSMRFAMDGARYAVDLITSDMLEPGLPESDVVAAKADEIRLFISIENCRADFEAGTVSVDDLSNRLGLSLADTLQELDDHGIGRSIEALRSAARSRDADRYRIIEQDRRARSLDGGRVDSTASAIERSVIATQRLEGLDARPWARARRQR